MGTEEALKKLGPVQVRTYICTIVCLSWRLGGAFPCTIRLLFLWPIEVVSFTFLLAENWPIFLQLHCSGPERMNFHRLLTIKRFRSLRLRTVGEVSEKIINQPFQSGKSIL